MTRGFAQYDTRHYPTVDVVTGYSAWAHTYDQTVHDELDLPLLANLQTVPWSQLQTTVDLGCGTGRIGTWLRGQGSAQIHGVDCTPAMLHQAAATQAYTHLCMADITHCPLPDQCNWSLLEMQERVVDDTWIAHRPGMARYRHYPISFVMVWQA